MIVEREYYVKLSEIGKENKITNKALLGILEDIGGVHSNICLLYTSPSPRDCS